MTQKVSTFPVSFLSFVGIVLVLASGFVYWMSAQDPAPRSQWQTLQGIVSNREFGNTEKLGETLVLQLEGSDQRYAIYRLERLTGLKQRLDSRVPLGASVAIATMPSLGTTGESQAPLSIPILSLDIDGKNVYDRDRDSEHTSFWWKWIVRGIALLVGLVGLICTVFGWRTRAI